jgi:hypothetical protein
MPEGLSAPTAASTSVQKWINSAQLTLSLITAAGAFYVSIQQHRLADAQARLTLQIDKQAKTTRYAEELTKYIERIQQQDDKESPRLSALMIDLADAVTSAASSTSGEIENNRLRHMPMWLALCTGNADGLRLIAGNAEGRRVWLPMALQSTDRKVRETAIEVIRTSTDQPPAAILASIFELSDELDNPDLEDKALGAMRQVISRMKRRGDPALEPGDRALRSILIRIGSMRTSLRGSMTAADVSRDEREKLQKREGAFSAALESFGVQETLAMSGSGRAGVASIPPPLDSQQVADNREAFEALDSDDAENRRKARAILSSRLDPKTAAALLESVRNPKATYRAKLGALVALRDTSVNVPLSIEDVRSIVALIGHDDATMRTHASELLMKITDAGAVSSARAELARIVSTRDGEGARPNQVYNAVAVLGTWSRVLPDSLADERAGIESFLRRMKADMSAPGSRWGKTAALIDDLLVLKAKQQVAQR